VVNLNATEARVEALTTEYIQLRPEGGKAASGEEGGDANNYFMFDDDENYQYEVWPCLL
jgi:hypothetical protein